jgi:Asp-tRNA(Asn)/Glu-tRNA(Gln) amidotransferase A subunit family amidase
MGESVRGDRKKGKMAARIDSLRSGELAVGDYLAELEAEIERREPEVRALLEEEGRFDRLRREAAALAERWPDPAGRPALFGVPIGVKDIFHVAGFETRAGSRVPASELAPRAGEQESEAVRRLKEAGALVLGKTVTTEFAYFQPGPTRNPHNLEHTPGGSSSGSAAAVAAGFCDLALGTQTIGSISRPASFCGVVGFKPSYDRISRAGVIPLSPSLDHVGVFTPDVGGAARAAAVLCEEWSEVSTPGSQPATQRPTLAVPTGPYLEWTKPAGRAAFESAVERLEGGGYRVVHVEVFPDFDEIVARHRTIVAAEAAAAHAVWFEKFGEVYGEKTAELIETGRQVDAEVLAAALAGREALRGELATLASEHQCDLWISPAARGEAPEGIASTGDPIMNLPWTHAGLPTVAFPVATSAAGLPLGVQVVAGWRQDEQLLSWVAGMEEVLEPVALEPLALQSKPGPA